MNAQQRAALPELARVFLRLGSTAFGGPAAHTALQHQELVVQRQWLSEEQFLDLVSAANLIPGPNSTELVIHIGLQRTGYAGMLVAGLQVLGLQQINFLGRPNFFTSIYVWSGVWQDSGYAAIIYLAALSGVDPALYEAARVDGASRIQKIMYVDLPGIMPVAVILLILSVGSLMAIGFEKIYLLQNPLNLSTSEIIPTYVYKIGLLNANFSFATAVGLFNSVINMILLVAVNSYVKRVSDMSLW